MNLIIKKKNNQVYNYSQSRDVGNRLYQASITGKLWDFVRKSRSNSTIPKIVCFYKFFRTLKQETINMFNSHLG